MASLAHFVLFIDNELLEGSKHIIACIDLFNKKQENEKFTFLLNTDYNEYLIGSENNNILSNEGIDVIMDEIQLFPREVCKIEDVNKPPTEYNLKDELRNYSDLMLRKMILNVQAIKVSNE